ncbi:hypothetical protein G6M89_15250 [Natronolimnobius sp. AArcel1]|uniref:hypothetical protein n=1 Tax=Natronolimnobius sp. AArcel1 TaxID=1679093 RepID=UPI0013EA662B|nr:hypothetical protein [Natronolimnobius sp. AArcel1]NGM70347.1 hypothetical protein [Natronolimnobius sp. AArcel1]
MTELTIYDSQGERYDNSAKVDQRLEQFFFGGVRAYLDIGSTSELIVFFRARESKRGRAEQYYAVYRTQELRKLFERFKRDLRQRVEEYGMTLQTTSDDVAVFKGLGPGGTSTPGTPTDHDHFESLLQSGHQVHVGVQDADSALGVLRKYSQGDAKTIAIGENTAIDALEDCDLTIEIGDYSGLEPLRETEELIAERTASQESHSGSDRPLATGSSSGQSSSRGRILKFGALGLLGLVGLIVLAIVGINVAALQGISHSATEPLTVVGEGEDTSEPVTPTLENITIEGAEDNPLVVDGETQEELQVTPADDGTISISADTEFYQYNTSMTHEGTTIHTEPGIANGDFTRPYQSSDLTNGEWELQITAGEDPDSDEWPEASETVTVIIDGLEEESESEEEDGSEDES